MSEQTPEPNVSATAVDAAREEHYRIGVLRDYGAPACTTASE